MSAQQLFPVPCECGKVYEVTAGSAGSKFACECGRTVEVPSLVKLRASVGQSGLSADFELDQMLGTGALPVEDTCGICGMKTARTGHSTVVCERAREEKQGRPLQAVALGCLFGLLFGWILYRLSNPNRPGRAVGRDVFYSLPIRVCESCAGEKWTVDVTRSVLERTPLYARLLAKYPKAKISLPA